ncbi:MAG: DEAD/DEAH box helicase [Planctomycetes bacterium]|nr:DEAD/DEAH box helicase [Planctomycetota bacterium]
MTASDAPRPPRPPKRSAASYAPSGAPLPPAAPAASPPSAPAASPPSAPPAKPAKPAPPAPAVPSAAAPIAAPAVADASAPATAPATAKGFAALGVDAAVCADLAVLGYEEPTPIQREAIPPLLAGRDVLGQAATGTGKTAAFALPLLQRAVTGKPVRNKPTALVLVPTRELAMQVAEAIHRYGRARAATVLPIYGGQEIRQQLRVLDRGVEVIVATPGRALDHLNRRSLMLDDVKLCVLDEADEMLDMGFAEDIEAILAKLPADHQTALFSATLAPRILAIARSHLRDPVRVTIARERPQAGQAPRVRQVAYMVPRPVKHAALGRVLDMEQPTSAIVFCRTRLEVDELQETMNARGWRAEALHGGFQQEQRDRVMKRFREQQADLLIATDVAARGLDIEHVSHVVNYGVPSDPDDYVHRIGRTGRAGREGVAITFVEPREHRLLRNLEFATRQKIALEQLPTVADLKNRRLELTRASLREAVLAGELEPFKRMVEELASELDPMDVAAAAAKLAHDANHAASGEQADEQDLGLPPPREWGPPRDHGPQGDRPPFRPRGAHDVAGEMGRIFIGAGRIDGLRPGDLVGAIANEAGVPGAAIGSVRITDRFALVEVPAEAVDQVIDALRGSSIRGRRVTVRRDLHA